MDWFTEEGKIKWMLIDTELKNFKTSMDVFVKYDNSKDASGKIRLAAAEFALDMMKSIGKESPEIYKALWSLYPDEVKEMFKLCINSRENDES